MGRALIGRDADLALVDDTLTALRTGRGQALFLTGEPGIGKSTLLAEARERVGRGNGERAPLVLTGAAWESGGAPPYWPWQQVLREAAAQLGDRVRTLPGADQIAALIPGWGAAPVATGATTHDPAAARFGLLDAVVRALLAIAAERPIVILLDDLHAADLPTLDLLVLFVRELPRAPIALVAAWREAELAIRGDVAQRLARVARFGAVQPLRRLTCDEVGQWVGARGPTIFETTDGNPLFVEEMLRSTQGASAGHGVASVIDDHLALVAEPARALLAIASVLGRDIDPPTLARLAGTTEDAVATALRDAAAVSIVEKRDGAWRFRHVLLRDQLYDHLAPSRRSELHRRAGELLEAADPVRAAHHLLAGGGDDVPRAVAAARAAAVHATSVYAFEESSALLDAAMQALDRTADARSMLAVDIRIELAEALHHRGRADDARALCVTAADLARGRDLERFARAALVYARELTSGTREPTMIALLEEAAHKLPAEDSSTRARVLARLAAAMVPGPHTEVERAQQVAIDAVAMARRLGNDETLMFALRYAAHAHSYQVALESGYRMASEVIALSDKLDRRLETVDHRAWLVGGCLARGDFDGATTALERFEALIAPLPQPYYRWRIPIVRAAWATRGGSIDEAERHIAIARNYAREYDLERARWAAMFATLGVVAMSRSPERADAFVDEIRATARIGMMASNFISFVLAVAGRTDEARAELENVLLIPALVVLQFGAEAITLLGARQFAPKAIEMMKHQAELHPMVHGPQGSLAVRPSRIVLGELYALVDRLDDAVIEIERGLALARTIEAPPFIASAAAALSRVLARRDQPATGGARADRERAAELATEALRIAGRYELHGYADLAATAPAVAIAAEPPRAPRADALTIRCSAERARVYWRGRTLDLPASKGFEFLALLVDAPEREIHVSDLIGDDDRGDAGEVLDAKARAQYRARAEELQGELETATSRNDLGQTARLRAELEAITDELLAGTGLGGRARKAGSRVERARVNVQRRIKDAIRRLGAEDEALGRYLEATIRTGTFCSFVPVGT